MADNDAFSKSIGSCWKRSYEAAHGCGNPNQVAELAVSGACALIREHECPGFIEIRAVLEPFCMAGGQAILRSQDHEAAAKQCDTIARSYAGDGMGNTIAQLIAKVAQGMLFESQMTGLLQGDVGQLIASKLLLEIIDSLFLGRLDGSQKVNERFALCSGDAADALFDFRDKVKSYLPELVDSPARRLADDPTGQTLPKRRKTLPKAPTAELLRTSIG